MFTVATERSHRQGQCAQALLHALSRASRVFDGVRAHSCVLQMRLSVAMAVGGILALALIIAVPVLVHWLYKRHHGHSCLRRRKRGDDDGVTTVLSTLSERFGLSGHDEKAQRSK